MGGRECTRGGGARVDVRRCRSVGEEIFPEETVEEVFFLLFWWWSIGDASKDETVQ